MNVSFESTRESEICKQDKIMQIPRSYVRQRVSIENDQEKRAGEGDVRVRSGLSLVSGRIRRLRSRFDLA